MLADKCKHILDLMEQTTVLPFEVHYCSNGLPLSPDEKSRLIATINASYSHVSIQEHDCEFFAQQLSHVRSKNQTKRLRFDGRVLEQTQAGVRGITGAVQAKSLIEMLVDPKNPTAIDRNMFEENVRLYLGQKNEVNQQIAATASSERRGEFWFLNNGITVVCDSFDYQKGKPSPVIELRQPQVVNGGQTSFGLFELGNLFREQVDEIYVQVRIIETTDKEFRQRVAIATNSQSAIRGRDLRSNDLIQVQLERALGKSGYYYERKRDQFRKKSLDRRIDALRAGQAILAYYKREPHKAKTQSDRIFGDLYPSVFDPDWIDHTKVLAAVTLLKLIEDRRDLAVQAFQSRTRPDYSEVFLVEGVFHVLFVMGEICRRKGGSLDSIADVSGHLDEAVKTVGDFFASSGGAAYRVFRTAKTTDQLSRLQFAQQLNFDLAQ